jgi:uncharacterized membrane protein
MPRASPPGLHSFWLHNAGIPRETQRKGVLLKGLVFIATLSLIIGGYISYYYFNAAKMIYLVDIMFIPSHTVLYLIWSRKYRMGKAGLIAGSLRVYL